MPAPPPLADGWELPLQQLGRHAQAVLGERADEGTAIHPAERELLEGLEIHAGAFVQSPSDGKRNVGKQAGAGDHPSFPLGFRRSGPYIRAA